jgi:hypothetical protein
MSPEPQLGQSGRKDNFFHTLQGIILLGLSMGRTPAGMMVSVIKLSAIASLITFVMTFLTRYTPN